MNEIGQDLIGQQVIVRSNIAGVFYGTMIAKQGNEIELKNARKLRYWSGANGLEQLAQEGVKNPQNCQFTMTVNCIINTYEQILPCTEIAYNSINSVPLWKL